MQKSNRTGNILDIEFKVVYSHRRTLGISVLPDSTVIVRVPYRTSDKTISRIVHEKASWIIRHRDIYRAQDNSSLNRTYANGDAHLFRGKEFFLKIEKSGKSYIRFIDGIIEMGLGKPEDYEAVKKLLYKGYIAEAKSLFPGLLNMVLQKFDDQNFKPSGLIIRSMKRRWGSCSFRGIITLSTELIKLPDIYIEYVIIHELCHLKHHNHGAKYYELLTELYPEWKSVRKELRKYIR
jgi:predicted metal-dependent hydrolase